MARSYDQLCPIARTLDLIGERWTPLVLRQLFFGDTRYSELLEHLPGIPGTVLSDRLKTLERHGLVERSIYSEHPLRAAYHLTEQGRSLQPVLAALARWGLEHRMSADEARRVADVLPAHVRAGIGLDA